MPLGIVDDKETLVRSTARYFGIGTIYATFSIKAPLLNRRRTVCLISKKEWASTLLKKFVHLEII